MKKGDATKPIEVIFICPACTALTKSWTCNTHDDTTIVCQHCHLTFQVELAFLGNGDHLVKRLIPFSNPDDERNLF